MSTTIAKAFGNLEQTSSMKERKRYRQARSNTMSRPQKAHGQTSRPDDLDASAEQTGAFSSAPLSRETAPVGSESDGRRGRKANADALRNSPLKKRGQDLSLIHI